MAAVLSSVSRVVLASKQWNKMLRLLPLQEGIRTAEG